MRDIASVFSSVSYTGFMKIWGHFYFLVLTIAAAYFYQERLINFDSAQYTFHILQQHDFFLLHDRWVNYLTQWIPLLTKSLGLNLRVILILYSGGLMALIYLVYVIIAHVLKNSGASVLMVFVFGAMYRYKFYAGISEIIPSIAFSILYIAFFTKKVEEKKPYPFSGYLWHSLFGALISLSHPVPAFPLAGVYFFWQAYQNRLFQKESWLKFLAFCAPLLVKFASISKGSYESNKMSLLENASDVLTNPFDYHVSTIMIDYFQNEHWMAWIFFLVSLIYILVERKYLAACILFGTVLATFLLNLVTFSYLQGDIKIMIDGYMIFLAIPIGFVPCIVITKTKWKSILFPALIIFFCFNLARIRLARKIFQNRLVLIEETIDRHITKRDRILISGFHQVNWEQLWYPYHVPAESVLLSTLKKGPDSTAFMIVTEMQERIGIVSELNGMSFLEKTDNLGYLQSFNYKKYPNAMFRLPEDSNVRYVDRPAWLSDQIIYETNNWFRSKYGMEIK
jgi:hypothetical protein